MTQQVATTIAAWRADPNGAQQVIAQNTSVATSYKTIAEQIQEMNLSGEELKQVAAQLGVSTAELAGTNAAAAAATSSLTAQTQSATSALATQATQVQDLTDLYAALDEQAKQAATDVASVGDQGADTGGGGGFGGLTSSRRGLMALGSLAGGSPGLSDAARLISVSAAFGTLGVVIGAVAIGVKALADEEKAQEQVISSRLDTERQAAHDISQITSKQAQEKLAAAQQSLAVDEEISRRQSANGTLYTLSITDQPLKLAAALAGLDPTYNAYQGALAKNAVAIEADQATIDVYTASIDKNATAIADLQAAADAQTHADLNNVKLAQTADQMTAEQRQQKIALDMHEIQTLGDLIQSGKYSNETNQSLLQQQADLQTEFESLIGVTSSYADQLDREAKAKQANIDGSNAIEKGLEDLRSAQQALAAANQKVADSTRALDNAASDHADKLTAIQTDLDAKLQAIQTTEGEKEQQARDKLGAKLLDLQAKSDERIRQMKEQDNFTIEQDVARGDQAAAQAVLAQQKIKIGDEKRNLDTAKADAKKTSDEQLAIEKASADKQIAAARAQAKKLSDAENERYAKQYRDLEAANAKALDAQRGANAAMDAQRQINAFSATYWDAKVTSAYNDVAGRTNDFVNAMLAQANRLYQANQGLYGDYFDDQTLPNSQYAGNRLGSNAQPGGFADQRAAANQSIADFYAQYNANAQAMGNIRGTAPLPYSTFDDGGINMRPGVFYSSIPEAHIPLSRLGQIGGVHIQVDARGGVAGSHDQWQKWSNQVEAKIVTRLAQIEREVSHVAS